MAEYFITYKETSEDVIDYEKINNSLEEILCQFVGERPSKSPNKFSPIYHFQEKSWCIFIQTKRLEHFFQLVKKLRKNFSLLGIKIIIEKITKERISKLKEYDFTNARSWLKLRYLYPTECQN